MAAPRRIAVVATMIFPTRKDRISAGTPQKEELAALLTRATIHQSGPGARSPMVHQSQNGRRSAASCKLQQCRGPGTSSSPQKKGLSQAI